MWKVVCLIIAILIFPPESLSMSANPIATGVSGTSSYYNNARKLCRDTEGHLYCVYTHKNSSKIQHIYVAMSADDGVSWSELSVISTAAYTQTNPAIAIDGNGCLHVVWAGCYVGCTTNQQVRYSQSEDYGVTWSTPASVSATTGYVQSRPSIVVDSSDNIYVAWHMTNAVDTPNTQIYWSSSTDSGSTWGAAATIDAAGSYVQENVALAAAPTADTVHAVWRATTATSGGFYRIRLSIYSAGWGAAVEPATGNYDQNNPCVAVASDDDSCVVWTGTHAASAVNNQIQFSAYTGAGWSAIIKVSAAIADAATYPSISVDDTDDVHIVWSSPWATCPKVAPRTYNQIHFRRSGISRSVWTIYFRLTQANDYQRVPGLMWARWPEDGDGLPTNMLKDGELLIWTDYLGDNTLQCFASHDITFYQQGYPFGKMSRGGLPSQGGSRR
jgi:hypothetical protein